MKARILLAVILAAAGLLVLVHAAQDFSEDARKDLPHNFGSSFLVFRHNIQEELKLAPEQKARLEALLPEAMELAEQFKAAKSEEQKKALGPARQQEQDKLATVLQETLDEGQLMRLGQIEHQRDGLFEPESWNELQVSDEQRQQFMALIQQTHQEIEPLLEEARRTGKPGEIRPKVVQLRLDLQNHLEALLTDAQKQQWKEMLGKPMPMGDLFDLTSQ
jgi:Spy/CpxP family protein refolding chaperone